MTYSVFLAPITGALPQKSNTLNPFMFFLFPDDWCFYPIFLSYRTK